MDVYDNPQYYDIAFSFRDIPKEVDFLERLIAKYLKIPVKTFLEVASGNSPHIKELCKRGYRYVGLELNDEMIAYARGKIKNKNLPAEIIKGTLVRFSLPAPIDCALIFLGSLYVKNDDELKTHLFSVANALRSGGLYILDGVVSFYHEDVHTQSWEMEKGSVKIATSYAPQWTDKKKRLMSATITLDIKNGAMKKRIEHVETKKIYAVDEFIFLAEQTTYWEYVGAFSDFNMNKPPQEGARNILVLRRR